MVTRERCRGDTSSGQDWFNLWNNNVCCNLYQNFIYEVGPNDRVGFNEVNWKTSQDDFNLIYQRYLENNKITVPGAEGFNEFQEILRECCTRLPGVCATALTKFCQGKTRSDIAKNPAELNFCGCFAPESEIEETKKIFSTDPQCDPLCSRIDTIPLDDGKGNVKECTRTVCDISNISIQATKSSIGSKSVNFTQVCPNCGNNGCTCIISGTSLSGTLNDVGICENFTQKCGKKSICLKINADGTDMVVSCDTLGAKNSTCKTKRSTGEFTDLPTWLKTVIIIAVILVILLIIGVIFSRLFGKREKQQKIGINQN